MNAAESPSSVSLRGIPNFYKAMFFVCFVLLVLLPFGILNSSVVLESREVRLDGRVAALDAEIRSLQQQITADANSIAGLENEVLDIARAEQVFSGGAEQGRLWGPDTRWSEMGRARVEELWRRQAVLQNDLVQLRGFLRQKMADSTVVEAEKKQIELWRETVKGRRIALYAVILVGVFATVLFALLWGALIQGRVNTILNRWARKV